MATKDELVGADIIRELLARRMLASIEKEKHDSINLTHYSEGSMRVIIKKFMADSISDSKQAEVWAVNNRKELEALLVVESAFDGEKNRLTPILVIFPKAKEKKVE